MLQLTIGSSELYNEATNEFITTKPLVVQLEHSLISLSKWESKWCKPFLSNTSKTNEETIDYIRCMTLTQNIDPNVYYGLSNEQINAVMEYIKKDMTATTIPDTALPKGKGRASRVVTSELIYCWMTMLTIPWEAQKWHLSRLIMLIKVCNVENQPPKKVSQAERIRQYAKLNAERRKAMGTHG